MAIAYEGSDSGQSGTGASSYTLSTYSLVNGSGNDRLLVVAVGFENSVDTNFVSDITISTVSGNEIGGIAGGVGYSANSALWYFLDSELPSSSGSISIVVTLNAATNRNIWVACLEYSGADQAAPDDSVTEGAGNTTATSETLTVSVDDSVAIGTYCSGSSSTPSDNLTILINESIESAGAGVGHNLNADTTSITIGWDGYNTRHSFVGAVFAEAGVSGPAITDVDTDEDIHDQQTGVTITGTTFETDGANSRVRINSASGGGGTDSVQTDTSWADTSIQFTVVKGSLSYGTNYVFVRNQSLQENAVGFQINLYDYLNISGLDDTSFGNGDTVEVQGEGFGASQSSSIVQLMDSSDGSGTNVTQTIDTWNGDTSIDITVVQGALDPADPCWIRVLRNNSSLGDSSARASNSVSVDLLGQPTITDVDTDEDIYIGQTAVTITGTEFGTEGANSRVRINSASGGAGTDQVQIDTSWADTSVQFTASLGSLSYGTNYLFVRSDGLQENATGFQINLFLQHTTTSLNDYGIYSGQTGVIVNGTNFNSAQGTSKVYLCDSSDGSGTNVEQTVTNWTDTAVTFTVVQGGLSLGTVYVIVARNQSSLGDTGERFSNSQTCTLSAAPTLTYEQTSFRAKNDNGGESSTDWIAALNADFSQATDTNFRIRFLVQETEDLADANVQFQLQYNHEAGGWNDVNGSSSVVRSFAGDLTDGGDTTQQLGSGTFVTPNACQDEANGLVGGASLDFTTTPSQEVEAEFCIQIRSADTSGGDEIQLRLVKEADTVFTTYTNTPTITLPSPPVITSVGADDEFANTETDVEIIGSLFYASQGTGKVELCPSSTYGSAVEQTIATWSSTSIEFDVVMGGLSLGTNYVFVTNSDGLRNATGFAVTIVAGPINTGLWKTASIQGTIASSGFTTTAFLIRDE